MLYYYLKTPIPRSDKMAQWVKAAAAKLDDRRWTARTCTVGGENWCPHTVLWSPHIYYSNCPVPDKIQLKQKPVIGWVWWHTTVMLTLESRAGWISVGLRPAWELWTSLDYIRRPCLKTSQHHGPTPVAFKNTLEVRKPQTQSLNSPKVTELRVSLKMYCQYVSVKVKHPMKIIKIHHQVAGWRIS